MGLFEKKYCDICGEKISLLGKRKLDDGNMCSTCAKLISPFMTDRRRTTIAEMKEHLAYREANKEKLAAFNPTETYSEGKRLYIDRTSGCFVVSCFSPGNWEKENPDVIPFSDVCGCNLEIRENRKEEFMKDQQGNRKSYSPPRYRFDYDFYLHIALSSRWFNEIEMKLNTFDVQGHNSQKYHNFEMLGNQMIQALNGNTASYTRGTGYGADTVFMNGAPQGIGAGLFNTFANQVAENARNQKNQQQEQASQPVQQPQEMPEQPAGPWQCPNCGAPNGGKFCENCGTRRP